MFVVEDLTRHVERMRSFRETTEAKFDAMDRRLLSLDDLLTRISDKIELAQKQAERVSGMQSCFIIFLVEDV